MFYKNGFILESWRFNLLLDDGTLFFFFKRGRDLRQFLGDNLVKRKCPKRKSHETMMNYSYIIWKSSFDFLVTVTMVSHKDAPNPGNEEVEYLGKRQFFMFQEKRAQEERRRHIFCFFPPTFFFWKLPRHSVRFVSKYYMNFPNLHLEKLALLLFSDFFVKLTEESKRR